MSARWVEVNIEVKSTNRDHIGVILSEFVRSLVREFKERITGERSWHYLWESNPWPFTLRLRFYGPSDHIEEFKKSIEEHIDCFKSLHPNLVGEYCYGRHGKCGEEYNGEVDTYGEEGWKLIMEMLEFGAEVALKLMNVKKYEDLRVYAERYVHLFLNQLTFFVDELEFYSRELAFRYYFNKTPKQPSQNWVEQAKTRIYETLEKMLKCPQE